MLKRNPGEGKIGVQKEAARSTPDKRKEPGAANKISQPHDNDEFNEGGSLFNLVPAGQPARSRPPLPPHAPVMPSNGSEG